MQPIPTTWLFASHNRGKTQEMQALLAPYGISLYSATEANIAEVAESGESFLENALIKARHASLYTELPVLAEDSGLSLPALHGAPGIYSARFAEKLGYHDPSQGRDALNNQALLTTLAEVSDRRACYICVAVFLARRHDPRPVVGQGLWCGEILTAPRGSGGFGYDPLFYLEKQQKTVAELLPQEKAQMSHRHQAVRALFAQEALAAFHPNPSKTRS
jgi:XTP/dITP diphosphohydrolase